MLCGFKKVNVQIYTLISSLIYQPTWRFFPRSLDLFIRVPFQLHGKLVWIVKVECDSTFTLNEDRRGWCFAARRLSPVSWIAWPMFSTWMVKNQGQTAPNRVKFILRNPGKAELMPPTCEWQLSEMGRALWVHWNYKPEQFQCCANVPDVGQSLHHSWIGLRVLKWGFTRREFRTWPWEQSERSNFRRHIDRSCCTRHSSVCQAQSSLNYGLFPASVYPCRTLWTR